MTRADPCPARSNATPTLTSLRLSFRSETSVEQLEDQGHKRRRRDAVQRHREAGEGSGHLVLLKGTSGGDAVARQAHRETASVPVLDADEPQHVAREAGA